ncbi:MAG TPA: nuclear transport factor 2 family protein [Terriglobales bacterium]|nr:nuclear transport factor 2 family protein [Terriglobales bacterium]
MKHILRLGLVMLALASLAQAQAAASSAKMQGAGDAKDAITKLERSWESGMQNKDDKAVGKILMDGWQGLNPDGSTEDKPKFLSEVKSGQYSSVKLDSINVKTYGSTAIATGNASDKDGKYAYTDVFIRQGGTWKAVASQLAKIG